MSTRCLTWLLCLVALSGVMLTAGCAGSDAARRSRARTFLGDRENMKREWDWVLGFEDPSMLYDRSLPPYW